MDTFEAYLSPRSSDQPQQHSAPLEIEKRLERITSNFKKQSDYPIQNPNKTQVNDVLAESTQQRRSDDEIYPFQKADTNDDASAQRIVIEEGGSSDEEDEERPFFEITENDILKATEAIQNASIEEEAEGITNITAQSEVLAEESMESDEESKASRVRGFDSPFHVSKAEEEYEEMLLSPAQRNRIRNKRRRKVFVAVRVRPFLGDETAKNGHQQGALAVRGDSLLLVNPEVLPGAPAELVADMVLAGSEAEMDMADWARPFEFGACLWSMGEGDFCDQSQLYDCLGKQLVDSMFNGIHVSAFAYGQTGSGKTYSMIGSDPLSLHIAAKSTFGLIPNALIDMMDRASLVSPDKNCSLRISVLEVYNDRLRDLLCPNRDERALKIREDPVNGPYAVGIEKVNVDLTEEKEDRDDKLLQLLSVASAIRVTADNKDKYGGHAVSSRGHAIVNVDLTCNNITTRGQLVDLAGSERTYDDSSNQLTGKRGRTESASATATKNQQRTRERAEIGKSLSNLNVIINGLSKGADPNSLPFRECKMTWLLKQGLAMDAHVVMLGTVSPAASSYDETLQTLLYAERLQRMRSAVATPVKKLVDASLIKKVLEDPARLLDRIHAFQNNAQSIPMNTQLLASPAHFGLTPTRTNDSSEVDSTKSSKYRKSNMRGLEISDPRQRLSRLTDFLNSLQGGGTRSNLFPASPSGRPKMPANTPSRTSIRARMLSPTNSQKEVSEQITELPQETVGTSFQSTADAGRGEVAFLRHEHANLEMEIHAIKVDRDVLELKVAESASDVESLRSQVVELRKEALEAERLRGEVETLKRLLSEQTQLTEDRQNEIYKLHASQQRSYERECEINQARLEAEAEAALLAEEQAEMDRLDNLTAAWYAWRAVVDDYEFDRFSDALTIQSGHGVNKRLTPEASPNSSPPPSPRRTFS